MKFAVRVLVCLLFSTSVFSQTHEYTGSSFNDVFDIITDRNFIPRSEVEIAELAVYQKKLLPEYPVNSASLFSTRGALTLDAMRTVSEKFDYYDRLAKKLHPNGVCVTGTWIIDQPSAYSGYFTKGSKGLFVGRISVASGPTDFSEKRGFGVAGKIFPTLNPDENIKTANFFAVDVLLGQTQQRFLDTSLTNQPEIGFDLSMMGLMFNIASALSKADEDPGFRPLTQISKIGDPAQRKTPKWMRLSVDQNIVKNSEKDFRNELLVAMRDNKSITLKVETSDVTSNRNSSTGWTQLGRIVLSHAVVSYGCDRRLHFSHPKKNGD